MVKEQSKTATEVFVVDIGNQITRFGLFDADELVASWSIVTRSSITADEARLSIDSFFTMLKKDPEVNARNRRENSTAHLDSLLSSVVPDLTSKWIDALTVVCKRCPLLVGPGLRTGIKMKYNDPAELGSDRIATMVAAKERFGYPLIVIDCGTVINYQILDSEGAFVGGIIAPGLELSTHILSQSAARLPVIDLEGSLSVFGKNTRDSMRSGIVNGEAARIKGLVHMIWGELGYETKIALVGENAQRLADLLDFEVDVDDDLTLLGLKMLYGMNRKG